MLREQIHVDLADQLWLSCPDKSLPITSEGKPFDNGWTCKATSSFLKSKSNKLVLRDGNKQLLGVTCQESLTPLISSFKIYSPTPLLPTQNPARKFTHSRVALYEWAEAISVRQSFTSEKDTTDANEHITFRTKGRSIGKMEKSQKWTLDIQSPEDTVLLLCFAAIVDELNQEGNDESASLLLQAKSVEGIVRRSMVAKSTILSCCGQEAAHAHSAPRRSQSSARLVSLREYLSQYDNNRAQDTPPCA